MNAQKRARSAQSAVPTMTRDELRRRILAVVNECGKADEAEIWRADAPNYLPWDSMVEEIQTLDRQKKLRREVVAPGHILIHSITAPPTPANPPTAATETPPNLPNAAAPVATPASKARKPKSAKASERTGGAAKQKSDRRAKQRAEQPVTEAQLADLIEQGYKHTQVREEHAYFLFQTGKQADNGQPIFLCNALGAAFVARHGLEQAWAMWEAFDGAAAILLAEDTQLPLAVINQVANDHTSSPDSLARLIHKLRADHHAG